MHRALIHTQVAYLAVATIVPASLVHPSCPVQLPALPWHASQQALKISKLLKRAILKLHEGFADSVFLSSFSWRNPSWEQR